MAYKVYNQYNYANVPYPAPGYENATVKSGGCGVCCASMIVENLTGKSFPPTVSAKYAISCKARVSGGTDIVTLAKHLISDYPLEYKSTNDVSTLIGHIKSGGMAIANVGGDRSGYKGVFSNGGHYIVVLGIDSTGKLIIGDPGLYSGKYSASYRKVVTVKGDLCYASADVLDKDCANRNPRYYLFKKKEDTMTGKEIYDALNQYLSTQPVPDWAKEELQQAVNAGITDGKNPMQLIPRYQAAIMAKRASENK